MAADRRPLDRGRPLTQPAGGRRAHDLPDGVEAELAAVPAAPGAVEVVHMRVYSNVDQPQLRDAHFCMNLSLAAAAVGVFALLDVVDSRDLPTITEPLFS